MRDARNVPAGVVPLRHVRGLARMPYLAVGDGWLRVYRHGFREPWAIPAEDVAVTAPTREHVPILATGIGRPNLRLAFARRVPPPATVWWVLDEVLPREGVVAVDVTVRDVPSAVATLADGGVAWADDVASWRLSRGEPPEPARVRRGLRAMDVVWILLVVVFAVLVYLADWRS